MQPHLGRTGLEIGAWPVPKMLQRGRHRVWLQAGGGLGKTLAASALNAKLTCYDSVLPATPTRKAPALLLRPRPWSLSSAQKRCAGRTLFLKGKRVHEVGSFRDLWLVDFFAFQVRDSPHPRPRGRRAFNRGETERVYTAGAGVGLHCPQGAGRIIPPHGRQVAHASSTVISYSIHTPS